MSDSATLRIQYHVIYIKVFHSYLWVDSRNGLRLIKGDSTFQVT